MIQPLVEVMLQMTKVVGLMFLNYLVILYLVYENGPKNILRGIRYYLGINEPICNEENEIIDYESSGTIIANMMTCHKCFGFWSGIAIWLIFSVGFYEVGTATVPIFDTNFYEGLIIIGGSIFLHEVT